MERLVHTRGAVIRDEKGGAIRLVGVTIDMARPRQRNARLLTQTPARQEIDTIEKIPATGRFHSSVGRASHVQKTYA